MALFGGYVDARQIVLFEDRAVVPSDGQYFD